MAPPKAARPAAACGTRTDCSSASSYGGDASCSYNFNDYYGKFTMSFSSLSQWLGTCGDQLQGFPLTTGISDHGTDAPLDIAPNPTTGLVTLSVPVQSGNLSIRIMDAVGRIVEERTVVASGERISWTSPSTPKGSTRWR